MDALNNYVLGGGKLVLNDWYVSADPANPLWATLGFAFVSDDEAPPDPVYWWKLAHPFFNTPQSVPNSRRRPQRLWRLRPARQAAAGLRGAGGLYHARPDPDQAALIVGNEGRTVFKGFLDGQNDANLDGDALPDGVELWINLIQSMVRVTVQARSQVARVTCTPSAMATYGVTGTGSTGSMTGTMPAWRTTSLVWRAVRGVPGGAVQGPEPLGFGSHRALTSQAAPGPALDEPQMDAAGNLPDGTAAAPLAPMAPEVLGDVVNSFLAPVPEWSG